MRTVAVSEFRESGQIEATCGVCHMSITMPDKGLGRAMVATFKTQHQHNAS